MYIIHEVEFFLLMNKGETGDPCGVPTETGEKILGEPWNRRRHDLPVKKDLNQEIR